MLEQPCRPEKERCRLLGSKCFSHIQQVDYSRKQCSAFPGTDGGLIKDTGLLDDGGFVIVVGA